MALIIKSLACAAAVTAVVALGTAGSSSVRAEDKPLIGLAVANLQVDPFNEIKQAIESYGAQKGLRVITVDARGDSATQVSQVQDLITRGIKALIYIPAGATAASVPVNSARAAGIPVIAVDRNPLGAPGDTFIANDSVESAHVLGDYVCKITGGHGQVAIIEGQLGTTPMVDRTKGFKAALADCPGLKIVATRPTNMWMQDEGFAIAQDMLQRDPNINVIFGEADSIALGAEQAVKIANLDHKVYVVGHDGDAGALKSIQEGGLSATMKQAFTQMGDMAVDSAIKLMAKQPVPKEQMLHAPLVTQKNVAEILAQAK